MYQSFRVTKLHPDAQVPIRKTKGAAGYDLFAVQNQTIDAGERAKVPIGISLEIPNGSYGRIAPRSSLAAIGIDTKAGVVDSDYRGEITVILKNDSRNQFQIVKGERVAQLILELCITPNPVLVDNLTNTERGSGGFGSTNKRICVRFKTPKPDSFEFQGLRFNIIKSQLPQLPESQTQIQTLDEEHFDFPESEEFYTACVPDSMNIPNLLSELKKIFDIDCAFEEFPPAPPCN